MPTFRIEDVDDLYTKIHGYGGCPAHGNAFMEICSGCLNVQCHACHPSSCQCENDE